jgi:uncharacterized membrane protein YkvA (DUF1232 family)
MNISDIFVYLRRQAAHLAKDTLENILILVVLIEWGRIPWWQWPVVVAALTYFLTPIDAMPDPIFVDDAGVLATAVAALSSNVTEDVRCEARRRARGFFGLAAE